MKNNLIVAGACVLAILFIFLMPEEVPFFYRAIFAMFLGIFFGCIAGVLIVGRMSRTIVWRHQHQKYFDSRIDKQIMDIDLKYAALVMGQTKGKHHEK